MWMRAISVRRRRTRLRATAPCPWRGVTTPTLERPEGDAAKNTSTMRPRRQRPARMVRRNSRAVRSRAVRGRRKPSGGRPLAASSLATERVTDGEPTSTLPSAARQRAAARLRLHARPESMVANALPVGWLAVCGLSHLTSPEAFRSSHRAFRGQPGSLDLKRDSVNSAPRHRARRRLLPPRRARCREAFPFVDTRRRIRLRSGPLSHRLFLMPARHGWS